MKECELVPAKVAAVQPPAGKVLDGPDIDSMFAAQLHHDDEPREIREPRKRGRPPNPMKAEPPQKLPCKRGRPRKVDGFMAGICQHAHPQSYTADGVLPQHSGTAAVVSAPAGVPAVGVVAAAAAASTNTKTHYCRQCEKPLQLAPPQGDDSDDCFTCDICGFKTSMEAAHKAGAMLCNRSCDWGACLDCITKPAKAPRRGAHWPAKREARQGAACVGRSWIFPGKNEGVAELDLFKDDLGSSAAAKNV